MQLATMGKRAASRLVMVSGISEEFWGEKDRTGIDQPCSGFTPEQGVNRHNLQGSTVVLGGTTHDKTPTAPCYIWR